MFIQLFSISRNTFVEAIRQPIFVVLLLCGALVMAMAPFMSAYSMEPGEGDNKMLVDLGLGNLWLVGMLLAAFIATGAVNAEMESKTALTVVSKPVARPIFVLGKYLGVCGALLIANLLLLIVLLFTIRHKVMQNASDDLDWPVLIFSLGGFVVALSFAAAGNYLYKKVFTSLFTLALLCTLPLGFVLAMFIGPGWVFQPPLTDWQSDEGQMVQIAVGALLITQGVLVLTAVAVALSTRFGTVITLIASGVVLIVGMLAGSLSQMVNQNMGLPADIGLLTAVGDIFRSGELSFGRQVLYVLVKGLYVVAPNFQFHWPADAISQKQSLVHTRDGAFSLSYLGTVSVYSVCYITAVLGLAVVLFQKREVS
ncbi:MAG: hypothetical protein AAGC44_09630 [Planctomycetota bacterium]